MHYHVRSFFHQLPKFKIVGHFDGNMTDLVKKAHQGVLREIVYPIPSRVNEETGYITSSK